MGTASLLDRSELTDLVSRLGVVLDEGRFDEMHELFTEDASARTPGGEAVGRDKVVAQAARNHDPRDAIQHVITNLLVDVDGDRATMRANLVVHFAGASDAPSIAPPITFSLGEVYRFEAARTPDGWRLTRVETVPVWVAGDPPRAPQPAAQPAAAH